MNWFKRRRMAWIEEMLNIYGFINREHLIKKFGIARAQASYDLTAFARAYPSIMHYDTSRKCYMRGQGRV